MKKSLASLNCDERGNKADSLPPRTQIPRTAAPHLIFHREGHSQGKLGIPYIYLSPPVRIVTLTASLIPHISLGGSLYVGMVETVLVSLCAGDGPDALRHQFCFATSLPLLSREMSTISVALSGNTSVRPNERLRANLASALMCPKEVLELLCKTSLRGFGCG